MHPGLETHGGPGAIGPRIFQMAPRFWWTFYLYLHVRATRFCFGPLVFKSGGPKCPRKKIEFLALCTPTICRSNMQLATRESAVQLIFFFSRSQGCEFEFKLRYNPASECERTLSVQNLIKTCLRSRLTDKHCSQVMCLIIEGGQIEDFYFYHDLENLRKKKNST